MSIHVEEFMAEAHYNLLHWFDQLPICVEEFMAEAHYNLLHWFDQ
jgi:hypothetical protein